MVFEADDACQCGRSFSIDGPEWVQLGFEQKEGS